MPRSIRIPIRELWQCTHQPFAPRRCLLNPNYTPLSTSFHTRPSYHPQAYRTFSTTPSFYASSVLRKAKPSMSILQSKQSEAALRSGDITDDLGLYPDTFILPRKASERWSWRIRKAWLKRRLRECVQALVYRWITVKPRPGLELGKIPAVAMELHREIFEAFGRGQVEAVEAKVCSGLLGNLRHRISQRPRGEMLQWRLERYLSRPRLVSYNAGALPSGNGERLFGDKNAGSGFVQAVVRIHSVQSLTRVKKEQVRDEAGKLEMRETVVGNGGEGQGKESLEYVVVQKMIKRRKEERWKLWGFAEETTLEKLEGSQREKIRGKAVGAGA